MNAGKTLKSVTTVLLVASFAWAWLWAFTFWNRIEILTNKEGYSPAEFKVTSIEFSIREDKHWLSGIVNGVEERLSFTNLLEDRPESKDEVVAEFPPNTEIEVWYNPSLTRTMIQTEYLRVLPYGEDLWSKQISLAWKIGLRGFLPLFLSVVAKVAVWFLFKKDDASDREGKQMSLQFGLSD